MDGWETVDRERAAAYARELDMACFYVRCEVFQCKSSLRRDKGVSFHVL